MNSWRVRSSLHKVTYHQVTQIWNFQVISDSLLSHPTKSLLLPPKSVLKPPLLLHSYDPYYKSLSLTHSIITASRVSVVSWLHNTHPHNTNHIESVSSHWRTRVPLQTQAARGQAWPLVYKACKLLSGEGKAAQVEGRDSTGSTLSIPF